MVREALTQQRLRAMPADEAAAYWLARRTEGLTAQEQELLEDWLSWNPTHPESLDDVDRIIGVISGALEDEILEAMRVHALAATAPRTSRIPRWAAAAAMIVALIVSTMLLVPGFSPPWRGAKPEDKSLEFALVYASAKGEVREIALPDGTHLTLDTDTLARGDFTGATRSIKLVRGRAFFDVRHDKRPFSVLAGNRRVVAIGTKFDVGLNTDELVVRLLEGKLTVGPTDSTAKPVILRPSQSFAERRGRAAIRTMDDLEEALSWRQGYAYFSEDSLAEAAAQINRYSDEQIIVRDPDVAALPISGQFRTGKPERFVHIVERIYPVKMVRRSDKQIEIISAR